MLDDFRQKLITFAGRSVTISTGVRSEASTNISLVLPLLALLGYDDRNPLEVCPEHSADFSEKYKNRVDYAILRDGLPVIAIESKLCGTPLKDERGQLRGYFNAAPTVKMGVLTDGLVYEFYADADEPNMMDQTAFLTVDLRKVAKGIIEDGAVDGLRSLQKESFNPENIGAEARRKLIFKKVLGHISKLVENPSTEFVREIMASAAGLKNIGTPRLPEYEEMVRSAFSEYVNLRILRRLDLTLTGGETEKKVAEIVETAVPVAAKPEDRIVTTETELAVLAYAKHRLAFLVEEEEHFAQIEKIDYRDYQGKFVVYYKKERRGRLFDLVESSVSPKLRVTFADGAEVTAENLAGLRFDSPLLAIFLKRIEEDKNLTPKRGEDVARVTVEAN